jgi:hypothetical protein
MGIYKRAHIRGMVHELTRQGIVSWPTKFAEDEAADAIADNMGEEEVPELTPPDGLSPEQAKAVLDQIVEVAQTINEHADPAAIGPEEEELKQASASLDYADAAAVSIYTLMQKVAEESSSTGGPMVPGETPPKPELGATAEAEIDAKNYPSAEYTGEPGSTRFNTAAGAVGQEMKRDVQPGAQENAPMGNVSKLAAILAHLGKSAADGASLSGGDTGLGKAPAPRKDLPDNINIPGAVASSMGHSAQSIPQGANVGTIVGHPGGEPGASAPVSNQLTADVGTKQAMDYLLSTPEGREHLRKVGAALL